MGKILTVVSMKQYSPLLEILSANLTQQWSEWIIHSMSYLIYLSKHLHNRRRILITKLDSMWEKAKFRLKKVRQR